MNSGTSGKNLSGKSGKIQYLIFIAQEEVHMIDMSVSLISVRLK